MKYVLAVAIMALGFYGLTAGGASAHHSTAHSIGTSGTTQSPVTK
jgi:hypothetical protein